MYQYHFEVLVMRPNLTGEWIDLNADDLEYAKAAVEAMPEVSEIVEVRQFYIQ